MCKDRCNFVTSIIDFDSLRLLLWSIIFGLHPPFCSHLLMDREEIDICLYYYLLKTNTADKNAIPTFSGQLDMTNTKQEDQTRMVLLIRNIPTQFSPLK